ncbi:MAG TPA: alpha/beta hydrolase [Acidimicrobiales bacterium]|nr:alpha/beta hydrolase [Acidimicrobiales bacterium]
MLAALVTAGCGSSRSPLAAPGGGSSTPASTSPGSTSPASTGGHGTTTPSSTSPPSTTRSSPDTSTPTTSPSSPRASKLRWSACRGGRGPSGYQCATLLVPLDYADPGKGTIGIALDRRVASGSAIGSLLINPGGPGVSGVDFLPQLASEMPADVLDHFNVVGFDPRGVDRSDPVTCGDGPQLDAELDVNPAPTTGAGWTALIHADRAFVAGCEARSRAVLPYVGTRNAARDMDRIRSALGDPKLNYLGFSYGTELGAVYADMFPTHIRTMVLDGALDPELGEVATVDQQSAALENELGAFFRSCDNGGCGWDPAGGPAAAFKHLYEQVTAHPMAVSGTTQTVGPAAFLYAAAAALYSQQTWPYLGAALTALQRGNGSFILQLFDSYLGRSSNGTYSNEVEAETAIDCDDSPSPSLSALRADGPAAQRGAPYFGLLDLYSAATCDLWPVKPTLGTGPIHADGSPPIVVVGSTEDPITPYAWAKSLAGQLQHGVLLTRDGYGHTGYEYSACIRNDVDAYLLRGTVPARGTTCPSNS